MVVAVIPWVLSARTADAIVAISTIAAATDMAFAACVIFASPLYACTAGANDHRKAPGWQACSPQRRWRVCRAPSGNAAYAAALRFSPQFAGRGPRRTGPPRFPL